MSSYRRVFWSLVLPIATATYLITGACMSRVGRGVTDEEISKLIVSGFGVNCNPEPAEQLAFLLAILLPTVFAFLFTILLRVAGVFRRPEPSGPWIGGLALASQLCLIAFGIKALTYQVTIVHRYRFLDSPALMVAATALGLMFAQGGLQLRIPQPFTATLQYARRQAWLPWGLALAWTVTYTVTGIYRAGELPLATEVLRFHIPYTMGEYAAVLNGRVPLVDFFPQYNNLQIFVAYPVLRALGFGAWSFTLVMFGFSTATLMLIYATLTRIFGSPWGALVVFVPIVAVGCYAGDITTNGYMNHAFNYYAVGPMRYFGFSALAWLAAWYLARPALIRLVVSAPLALLVLLNNLDFGIPAALGMLACILLFPPPRDGAGLVKRIVWSGGLFLLLMVAALGLVCLTVRLAVGSWPMLDQLFVFQRTFALIGYFMLPMPQLGAHWIIYLTSISAVVIAIYETFSAEHAEISVNRRVINGSLAYAGVASFGPLAYYVGRSHAAVMVALFLAWAFVLAQLLHRAWLNWREAVVLGGAPVRFLLPVPLVATAALFCMVASMVFEVPNVKAQYRRLSTDLSFLASGGIDKEAPHAALIRLTHKYVPKGKRAVIVYPNAHWLALQAGVENICPYVHTGSVILKDQINVIMAALARLPRAKQYLFGSPMPDLRERLMEAGYSRVDAVGDFGVWSRNPG